jgi:4-amino-4-deoxy-L-arabinose transferase-like glycosyltransferase
MLLKIVLSELIWRRWRWEASFPYISLLFWLLPLLLFNSGHSSLMAHDEGLYAWRSRQMFDSGNWIAPWPQPHHKTPGPYWLIALVYILFGVSEASVRLPSMIFGVLSVLVLYEIGKILLGKKVGWLAAAIFCVEFLWLQYCRLGTPDVPMIFLVLLAIYCLLKAELHPRCRHFYSCIAGVCFGLGFLLRSLMIFVPIIALFPYLICENCRHRHLQSLMLYLGFAVGLIPTIIWLWLNFLRFGNDSIAQLFQFVWRLGSEDRGHHGIFFYCWNVPIKAFPWFFFGLFGLFLIFRSPLPRYNFLLAGFPISLFVELSLFSTRLPHYSLVMYPFIALLAALGLDWLSRIEERQKQTEKITFAAYFHKLPRYLSYIFGLLAILLLLVGAIAFASGNDTIRKYAIVALALGSGWLILPVVWIGRYRLGKQFLTCNYWLAGWLLPAWLALAFSGMNGFFSDYNPEVKAFLTQPAIAHILANHPIYFVNVGGKIRVLLDFYTPHHAQKVETISQLPAFSYAWIWAPSPTEVSRPHRLLGTLQQYQLIQILPDPAHP